MKEDCIFCKIIKGEIPSEKVYEDEYVLAFRDINPAAPIHILIIPKKHIDSLICLKEEDKEYVWKIHEAMNIIAKQENIVDSGYRIVVNCGKDAGQEVMHLHYHLLAGQKMGEKII